MPVFDERFLQDPSVDEAFRGQGARLGAFQRLFGRAMVFLDAPDHARLRHIIAAGFHPSMIQALAPAVETLAEELLAPLDDARQFDFIEAFARPFPSRVIALLLGIEMALQGCYRWVCAGGTNFFVLAHAGNA